MSQDDQIRQCDQERLRAMIHLYHGNAALLTESLEVIQQTSALILSAIEGPAIETAQDSTDSAADAEVA